MKPLHTYTGNRHACRFKEIGAVVFRLRLDNLPLILYPNIFKRFNLLLSRMVLEKGEYDEAGYQDFLQWE
jgi:hypothetical protein